MLQPKPYLIFLLTLLFASRSDAQSDKVSKFLDTTLSIMQQHAVNAKAINWKKLRADIDLKTSSAKHPYELGDVYRDVFRRLNDFHGSLNFYDSVFRWSPKEFVANDSIVQEWNHKIYLMPQILANDIGYLRIPSMSSYIRQVGDSLSQNLYDSVCYLLKQNPKGIILDLRLNGGGSIHPMILGLQPLLQPGKVGSFLTSQREDWTLTANSLLIGKDTSVMIRPRAGMNAGAIPVVILTSSHTGSSGEFLVIAFKGRANTKLLGSTTAGYTTVIAGYPFAEYSTVLLSVGYGADRTGKIYKSAIVPDITMTATDKFNNLMADEKVQAAIRLLSKKR